MCCAAGAAPAEGYDWPQSNHGLTVDHKNNVWIGGNVGTDSHILKFTQDGKFIAQYGKPQPKPTGSNDTENFGRVAKIFVDPRANEAYIADGYGNKRVAVLDGDTGKFKRYWGAYGNKPDDTNLGTVRSGGAAGPAVPHAGALRRSLERRPGLRLRPAQQPAPGVHAGRQVRQGSVLLQEDARRRRRLGRRVLEGSRAEILCISPTARTSASTSCCATRSRSCRRSAAAAASPGSSSPSTASPPIRKATSTRPKPTRAAACRSSCSKA